MKKNWVSIFLFSLVTVCSSAQTEGYKFYSRLDPIATSGFYNIEITPELSAHLKTDYSDLRIINGAGKWVPHVLRFPASERSNETLAMNMSFTRAENTKISTTLLIENSEEIISNIELIIRNTAAERFCTLSGSDDRTNWFVVNDSIMINPISKEKASTSKFRINFPPSSYKFLKITIHNNNKDPFDIKGVVQYTSSAAALHIDYKLTQNPVPNIIQKDSGKISYIKISQQQPFHFDNISLKLSGVKYFYRKVDLYIPYSENHSFANPGQLVQSFTISNNSTLQFYLRLTKASFFYLLINNEDNLPLTVNEVKTACNARYATSYLEKGVGYKLLMDNEAAVTPNYDLTKPDNRTIDSIPTLQFGKITAMEEIELTVRQPENNKWIIWVAIISALSILLFFTFRMLNDLEKRKKA